MNYLINNLKEFSMASEWVGLSVLMDLLGTDANGEVEVYDKEAFFGALDKKADKVKKRTLSKSHLKKMMDGKKKANS